MRRRHTHGRRRWRPDTFRSILVAAALVGVALIAERFVPALNGAVRISDGDSFELGGERIRLDGIDAPELHQSCGAPDKLWPCGERARAALEAIMAEGKVSCRPVDEDRYERAVSVCEAGGRDVAARLVEQGWAVATGLTYAGEQRAARAAGRGIWAGPFDMPADWRAAHPRPAS
jgi:endonuclease YncB( thermonuclease family)